MRVALIGPLVAPIAAPFLGGAQAVLYDLAAGLAARGHDVTLYAADGTNIPAVRTPALDIDSDELRSLRFARGVSDVAAGPFVTQAHHFLRIALAIAWSADSYDVVNAHAFDWPAFAFAGLLPLPVLHTLHLPNADRSILDALELLSASSPQTHLAAVSRACAATYAPRVAIETILYNGIHTDEIPFGARPADDAYVLWAGRIAPEKGTADALEIARRAGRRIVLAGSVYDETYFSQEVRPRLGPLEREGRAQYLGGVPRERLWQLMAGASAVLVTSLWEEPFGIVPCEAMAAGTPVVGYAVGALPEVVDHGHTGWLVAKGDIAAGADALARGGEIARADCREHIVQQLSLPAMIDAYEQAYATLAGDAR